MLRHFQLDPVGLEVFFSANESLYLSFKTEIQRSKFHESLLRQPGLSVPARKNHGWVRPRPRPLASTGRQPADPQRRGAESKVSPPAS